MPKISLRSNGAQWQRGERKDESGVQEEIEDDKLNSIIDAAAAATPIWERNDSFKNLKERSE